MIQSGGGRLLKTLSCFPNNKPWITNNVKDILNRKKMAFKDADREEKSSELRQGVSEDAQGLFW